jgi:hypothetical protein
MSAAAGIVSMTNPEGSNWKVFEAASSPGKQSAVLSAVYFTLTPVVLAQRHAYTTTPAVRHTHSIVVCSIYQCPWHSVMSSLHMRLSVLGQIT